MTKHVLRIEFAAIATLLVSGAGLKAAELKQETLQAWDQYIAITRSQIADRLRSNAPFLRSGDNPDALRSIRAGAMPVAPVAHNPKRIPGGLIHHWIGAVFMPHSTIDDVLAVVRDYSRYKQFYAPLVIDSKPLEQAGDQYRFAMLMMNQSLFSRSALDGEYAESFFRVSDTQCYSVAYSTRVQQIDDFGGQGQRRLPPDEGSGYIWRIYSISRFEERDGGVYVELEAIALSRDIPVSLRWVVDPIVRRVARGSLLTSLEKTRAAVRTEAALNPGASDRGTVAQVPRQLAVGGR